jgi:hypothetical protein
MLKKLNNIGRLNIENEFERIFCNKKGFLMRNNLIDGHYFEMTGEFMYYALKELEEVTGISQLDRKEKIVRALQNRKREGNGVFFHKSFVGENDTQLRSTSAVIRTFLEARKDGFIVDQDILEVVNHHYSYYFEWNTGIWFCHDTSELKGKTPLFHLKTKVYNKSNKNTVTLNTHLDSLTTLLMVINSGVNCKVDLLTLASKAINSLNNLFEFDKNKKYVNMVLQKVDNMLFNKYLISLPKKQENLFSKFYQKIIHPLFFKIISPTIFFNNGFIGRDLAVCNIHVDYLTVNITDFLRLLVVYDKVAQKEQSELMKLDRESVLDKISKAIDLIETNKNLKTYIMGNDLQSAWFAEMHYLFSFYSSKYKVIVNELLESNLYNLETTSFVVDFKAKQIN